VARIWSMWGVKAQILRRFSAQEHDAYATIRVSALLWKISFTKIFVCTCTRYNLVLFAVFFSLVFWVSHSINQNTGSIFCIIRKYLLICKTFQLAAAECAHWNTYQLMSHCFPLLPRYTPHISCIDITFVCVHLND
jgi:hypothetical protein